jgi:hypothetical protein
VTDHEAANGRDAQTGDMSLRLGVVLSRTGADSLVRLLDSGERVEARHAEAMIEHGIVAEPGGLVAVDVAAEPMQIVYRWSAIRESEGRIPDPDGGSLDLDRLRSESFPRIREMYRRMAAAERVDPKRVVEAGYDDISERGGWIEESVR